MQPNVLFIMADQQRFDFLGYAGADFVDTPNLDRLASQGVVFENCFCNSPVCAPSRIGLASGMQPGNIGALDNSAYLPLTNRTYYQQLRDHGYHVGCCGKLDLAKPSSYNGREGERPATYTWGFTHPVEIEGKMHAGRGPNGPYGYYLEEKGMFARFAEDYAKRQANDWALSCHDSVLETEDHAETYVGKRSVEWIENASIEYPWHLFVSFPGPHDPFDPPTEYADRYRERDMPAAIEDSLEGKPGWHAPRVRTTDAKKIRECRQQYCGLITLIDDWIGHILDALERKGQRENTYIIFASDHGEMCGDHGMFTKAVAYEPSWHVPLVVAGPGIGSGRRSNALIELNDINPTICEFAGVSAVPNIEARSFAAVARGEADVHRENVICQLRSLRAIRTHEWKFVENVGDIDELYDMQDDPQELTNLVNEKPAVIKEMREMLKSRFLEREWLR